jgi:hypothetical protein
VQLKPSSAASQKKKSGGNPEKGLNDMAKRKVFGRRTVVFERDVYIVEMRADGVYVRRKFYSEEVKVHFNTIIKYSIPQLELGLTFNELDSSEQEATVSAVPEGYVVYPKPDGEDSDLHAGDEQETVSIQGRESGLDPSTGGEHFSANPDLPSTGSAGDKLPGADQ